MLICDSRPTVIVGFCVPFCVQIPSFRTIKNLCFYIQYTVLVVNTGMCTVLIETNTTQQQQQPIVCHIACVCYWFAIIFEQQQQHVVKLRLII